MKRSVSVLPVPVLLLELFLVSAFAADTEAENSPAWVAGLGGGRRLGTSDLGY